MYHVSAQGIDERMINVHYYYYYSWAFVYFPLVIPSFSSLVRCKRFGLFRCVYSSFHNRLDLIREPAFYWVFYFPKLSVFVSSYVKMKKFCSF